MAGPFSPAQVDFSQLANLPDSYMKGKQYGQQLALQRAFAGGLPKGPDGATDWNAAIGMLAQSDPASAIKFGATLASKDAITPYQQQTLRQGDERNAIAQQGQWATDPMSGRLFNKNTGEFKDGGAGGSPTNPYFTGKMTPDQGKASTFATSGFQADTDLNRLGDIENTDTNISTFAQGLSEGMVKNLLSTSDRQVFSNASRQFVNAINRRESGAVISPSEMAEAKQLYIPQYGDGADVIARKALARKTKLEGLYGEAGPNFTPPANLSTGAGPQMAPPPMQGGALNAPPVPGATQMNIDPNGNAGPNPPYFPPNVNGKEVQIIQHAREAIAAGADPNEVIKRLQQMGVNPGQ